MALAQFRSTPAMGLLFPVAELSYPVNGGASLFAGGLGCLNSEGNLVVGSTTTGLVCVGLIQEDADNADGGDGDISGKVKAGVFRMGNSGSTDEITAAEIGDPCYIVDDETVAKTDGSATRSVAGVVVLVDASGVWVAAGFNLFAAPTVQPAGSFIQKKSVTVPFNHASFLAEGDDGDAVDINVGTALPANAMLLTARHKITQVFAGVGVATLTMMVGFSGDTNGVIEAVDIFGDAVAEYTAVPGTAMGGPAGGKQLVANFDPDASAGLDELTAGSVTIDVFYFVAS